MEAFKLLLNIKTIILVFLCQSTFGANNCCDFDTTECLWSNQIRTGTWAWSKVLQPDTTGITDYQTDSSPNEWLQDKSLGNNRNKVALKVSPTLNVERNDVVSIKFYRHTPSGTTDDRLVLRVRRLTGNAKVLLNAHGDGWQQMQLTCTAATCCDFYPCLIQFQVEGTIKNSNELLAFDDFLINGCLVTTSPSPTDVTSGTISPDNDLVTVETTTVTVITTVTTTSYNQTNSDKPTTTSLTKTTSTTGTALCFGK